MSPICGYSSRNLFQFNNKNTTVPFIPLVEKILNRHCSSTVSFGTYLDPGLCAVHQSSVNHCATGNSRIKIVTCSSKNGFPFCNTLHCDVRDMFTSAMNKQAFEYMNMAKEYGYLSTHEIDILEYLSRFNEKFGGFSTSTRVTYHFVYKDNIQSSSIRVIQYLFCIHWVYVCESATTLLITFMVVYLSIVPPSH